MKVIIIGGVAGGAGTAARLRRLSEKTEILVIERGNDISYANCGIPYHIGQIIKDRNKLVIINEQDFESMFNLDVRIHSEVVAINRAMKTVTIKDLINENTYTETYDKLVLSPGGNPIRPPIPGINLSSIFTLRNLTDMDAIIRFIHDKKPMRAIVVGAGFIGLEVAENLCHLGLHVSIVELAGQVMNLLDFEMATAIHQQLKTKQVELYLKDGVKEIAEQSNNSLLITLQSGRTIEADLAILSIGIRPEVALANECGIYLGALGGISVNAYMQTSDATIYALGDATEIIDCVTTTPALIPLANAANKQARIVANNIMGHTESYKGTPGTAIAKVFDLTVGIVGNSEKQLLKKGIKYNKVYLNPASHATYYPGSFPMIFKLLYSSDNGRVLGVQIIGQAGVDKRVDVCAALIQNQHTVYELASLELAYAPPYASAKDPVNLAGMIAINQIQGKNPTVYWEDMPLLIKEKTLFIDARSPISYELGHIENAINIPLEQMRSRLNEIPINRKVIVYCNQGKTAYFAICLLKNNGYTNVWNLSGGYTLYKLTALPQENVGIFQGQQLDKLENLQTVHQPEGTIIKMDACGLQCPGPIVQLAKTISQANCGDVIEALASDPGFFNDVSAWCELTNNQLLSLTQAHGIITARIQKASLPTTKALLSEIPHDKTIVVFSGDLDRALAAFVIANGAMAMGRKTTLFFTFWGLNILRKSDKSTAHKNLLEKLFSWIMPKGPAQLKLSNLHIAGIGTTLIKSLMKSKRIDSLETMIKNAQEAGVRIIACQMSMDLMGLKKEELFNGIEIGGVASYLSATETADTNLFI